MIITIGSDKKTLQEAKKKLQNIKKQIPQMIDEFYYSCYLKFVEYCRNYLFASTIGENIKSEIALGWEYQRTNSGATFINKTEKAVFVEFGVGVVGLDNYHSNAKKENYNYNIGSKINADGSWIFNVTDKSDIDIESGFILNETEHTVRTKGSPAVMYAFNALEDLRFEYPKIWENIKIKYWG